MVECNLVGNQNNDQKAKLERSLKLLPYHPHLMKLELSLWPRGRVLDSQSKGPGYDFHNSERLFYQILDLCIRIA